MPWNDGLDPQSPAFGVASSPASRLRVVAGPGTGKSFALKRRVARLLEENIPPQRILPVTFTRVAAEDLHRELVSLDVEGADALQGRTLHSLGLWILHRHNVFESTGRTPRPLNRYELQPLLYDLPKKFGTKIGRRKRIEAYEAAWARLQHEEPGFAQDPLDAAFGQHLTEWLMFHEAMLIGEIIPELYRYLRNNPAAPERHFFEHVLADEFQDFNKAEQRVVEFLGEHSSLCIVGDDDQSIYSFKHANPEGIRHWHEVHDETDDHSLLDCRRCPVTIVRIANSLIAHNQDREPRQLQEMPENGEGLVHIAQYQTLGEEITGVSNTIRDLVQNQDVPPGDILVLAQRKVIGTPIFENLHAAGISAKSYYQESELETPTAQERLSIFKLVTNQEDRVALRWLLGLGSNDFRSSAYRRVRKYCEQVGLSPWSVMNSLTEGNTAIPYTGHLIERFRNIEQEILELSDINDLADFITAWLPDDLEDVDQLRDMSLSCQEISENKTELLDSIIGQIVQPEIPLEVVEVRIMSLHRSKGLSSPIVVIAGCVEGLLPTRPEVALSAAQKQAEIEEQRRLFFVGLTRVKAQPDEGKPGVLYLTHSRFWPQADALGSGVSPAYIRHGNAYFNASRFLNELGPHAPEPQHG